MKHKLFRVLVALVLVCVLVVNVSPIRAQASALPEVAEVVTKVIPFNPQAGAAAGGAALGSQVFCWVLLGLGLIVTTTQAIELMNAYTEFSGELETSIYYYPDGSWSYGVDMGFVERVRAFLWDSGTLAYVTPFYDELTDGQRSSYLSGCNEPHAVCWVSDGILHVASSAVALSVRDVSNDASGWYAVVRKDGGAFYHQQIDTDGSSWPTETTSRVRIYSSSWAWIGTDDEKEIGSVYDLDYVAPQEVPMPEAYPEWHTNARPVTNPDTQEEITVLPIPLDPNTEELPDGVTQEDVWPGSVADPMPDTDTDTGTDTNVSETPWETFKKWISTGWDAIIEAIPTPQSIAEAVGNVIKSIFVPDADFISEKWNAIRSRFDFADSISSSGELILDVLNGIDPEPPVIYVDLGDAEGSYYLGGQVAFLDLRWYERYKPTGDAIISAFLWLVFVWRMFIKLPGIIGGLPGDFVMQGVTDLGLAGWLPARKKEYENQRQENRRFFKK